MEEALYIVKTLNSKGYIAYFAGGWVRDYLLNHPSDDIDIATNAAPEVVEETFLHTIPIGKAFGIILVVINGKEYEVATFRHDVEYKDGRRPAKIEFSNAQGDANRRDFTINGMFYDPIQEEIIDYVNGKEDLEKKIIRCIGNPHERIKEDRLRMIRAVRLSARFGFEIEKQTKQAIIAHAKELFPAVAIERIWQELTKMALYKGFKKALLMLFDFNLLQKVFPILKNLMKKEVEQRLRLINDFPHKTPVIISILELFKDFTIDQKIDLCRYLKLSNREMDFVIFYDQGLYLIKNKDKITDYDWVNFYASGLCNLTLQILAIHVKAKDRKDFLLEHEARQKKFQNFIDRAKNKDPIVKSSHLQLYNIKPGKLMGSLLKEAEKISVNGQITDVHKIIRTLKKTKIWPK